MRILSLLVVLLALLSPGCSTTPPPVQPSRADIAQDILDKTVMLQNPELGALCSGVWTGPKEIMTAAHCVKDSDEMMYKVRGSDDIHAAHVKVADEDHDIATLVTFDDTPVHKTAVIGPLPQVSDPVFAAGHPVGLEYSFSSGCVSAIRKMDGAWFIQATTPISPGNSGGGLFDEQGRL